MCVDFPFILHTHTHTLTCAATATATVTTSWWYHNIIKVEIETENKTISQYFRCIFRIKWMLDLLYIFFRTTRSVQFTLLNFLCVLLGCVKRNNFSLAIHYWSRTHSNIMLRIARVRLLPQNDMCYNLMCVFVSIVENERFFFKKRNSVKEIDRWTGRQTSRERERERMRKQKQIRTRTTNTHKLTLHIICYSIYIWNNTRCVLIVSQCAHSTHHVLLILFFYT